jgi:hypothetical protein
MSSEIRKSNTAKDDEMYRFRTSPLNIFPIAPDFQSPFTSITKTSFSNFYGSVRFFHRDPSSALLFFANNADVDISALTSVINGFVDLTLNDCIGEDSQKSSCHVSFWTWKSQPNGFGTPAWHRDGPLHPIKVDTFPFARSKYAVTLLGQPTRFLVNSPHIVKVASKAYDDDLRYDEMASLFSTNGFDNAALEKVDTGQVVRFSWGQPDGIVHAEPIITEDRVFLSIIYGNDEEIRGLAYWRDEAYIDV